MILLNEKLKFIALKVKRESSNQMTNEELTQINLTVKLLKHFTDETSLTVLKVAEKVGIFSYIQTLGQQDQIIQEQSKMEMEDLLKTAACTLQMRTLETLNLQFGPFDKPNSNKAMMHLTALCNAPLYNLNNPAYCKFVINTLSQSLCQQHSQNTQTFEWLTALLVFFCGIKGTIELSDKLKVCTRNILLLN